ncbi:hypothetical protein [Microbacterium sp. SS28]|uniref:hypothetical protein n=1 Tax=Microbacterium sp. SS28 TaxID=2919948 RepID=UPI001FA97EFA|nr:hypothetical protein [Microbacterium sp. SS28]
MSTYEGLSPREHDEMRDLVLAGTQRIRPAGAHRMQFVALGLSLALVGGVVAGVVTATLRDDSAPLPVATPDPSPTEPAIPRDEWIAYSSGFFEGDIYFVRPGLPPQRVLGAASDDLDQVCPAFSPDGTRLASGQARGESQAGWQDAGLVITDLTADGKASTSVVIPLDGLPQPPCPIWSPDGTWVAFGSGRGMTQEGTNVAAEVWLVEPETGDIRRLTGVAATDIEWARTGSELYIAEDDGVLVYSTSDDETRRVPDTAGAVALAASPDGSTLAVELRGDRGPLELWLMSVDGSERRLLTEGYSRARGIGPLWSPDGARIVFQRDRGTPSERTDGIPMLGENEEVVIVSVGDDDPLGPVGTVTALPPTRTGESFEPRLWLPVTVSWAPDSETLLFLGWEQSPSGEPGDGWGLLTVPVVGGEPPTILWETPEGIGNLSLFPQNDFQSWSRK